MGLTGSLICRAPDLLPHCLTALMPLRLFPGGLAVVGGVEVEVDATEGLVAVGLAEDDGDLLVEGDAVAEAGGAVEVGFDGLFHEGEEGGLAIVGGFVEADDMFFEVPEGFGHFGLERSHGKFHGLNLRRSGVK